MMVDPNLDMVALRPLNSRISAPPPRGINALPAGAQPIEPNGCNSLLGNIDLVPPSGKAGELIWSQGG
jgi:hypothetical protein